MKISTISTLLKAVSEGDEHSFAELFNLYKDQVYAYAMHFTRSVATSEEMIQEIFLKLWLHRKELPQIDCFEAYLYTITRNLCFDYLKKLAREQAAKQEWRRSADAADESLDAKLISNNYESLVRQALEKLPPQQQKIYTLSFYQDRKLEEIAQELHISYHTVKVHLAKARAAIRNYLAKHIDTVIFLLILMLLHHLN